MATESAAEWCQHNFIEKHDRLEVFVGMKYAPITNGWAMCRLVYQGEKVIVVERENSWRELVRTSSRSLRLPVL